MLSDINCFTVDAKIKRLEKQQKDFVKILRVSESAISQALKPANAKRMRRVLLKLDSYCNYLAKRKGIAL